MHSFEQTPGAVRRAARTFLWAIVAVLVSMPEPISAVVADLETGGQPDRWGTYLGGVAGGYADNQRHLGGDFDGDGHDDVVRIYGTTAGNTNIDLLRSDGSSFTALDWGQSLGGYWGSQIYLAADVDGNGRDDVIRIFDDGGRVTIDALLSTGVNFWFTRWTTRVAPYRLGQQFLAGDFDGDGDDDVAQVFDDGGTTSIDVFQTAGGPAPSVVRWATGDGGYWGNMFFLAGDFDGDLDDDVLRVFKEGESVTIDVLRSSGQGFLGARWLTQAGPWFDDGLRLFVGDFDGDQFADLGYLSLEGRGVTADVFVAGQDTFSRHLLFASNGWVDQLAGGDFDGDGKTEIAGIDGRYGQTTVDLYDRALPWEGNGRAVRWQTRSGWFAGSQRYLAGDFDGDGREDMVRVFNDVGATSIDLHRNDGSGFVYHRWATRIGWHALDHWFVAGDFNADGIDDVIKVFNDSGATSMDIYLGGPTGFTWVRWLTRQGGHFGDMRFVAGDFDGDGFDDVAKVWDFAGLASVDVYRSSGAGFHPFTGWADRQGAFATEHQYIAGDFDGDGRDDVARVFPDGVYTSVDVFRSHGSHFSHGRWMTRRGFVSLAQKHVTGDFDDDGRDDIVKFGPNAGGEVAMLLYRSQGATFEDHYFIEDAMPFAETAKVVAADFDGDGLAEVATAYRTAASIETNFDVYGGSLLRDPSLISSPGDSRLYSVAEVQANLAGRGFSLVSASTIFPGQCTIVYPGTGVVGTAAGLGVLGCARLNPVGELLMDWNPIYGGCDVAGSGGECEIGIFSEELEVHVGGAVVEFEIQGPGARGCAEVSRESVCAETTLTLWETSILIGDGNGNGVGTGVFVGVGAGGQVGYDNGILSGSVGLGLGIGVEIHYSLNTGTAISVGSAGIEYTQAGVDTAVTQGGVAVDAVQGGVEDAWDSAVDLGGGVVNGAKDFICKLFC